ncbi:SDR family oxidoreductase [Streptomyces sp. cg36]|uniref:SDR family oxidoreductase n=1 Tax=Streptomyces sp. cg36 TaxID=3238798 RepID=UPI0034E1D9BA
MADSAAGTTAGTTTDAPAGLAGKVVAVTGAGSGIGEATALLLAERGARLVLGARRTGRLADLAARIEAAGGTAAYVRTDVTRRDDLHALVALARERFGRLDVLVANAGSGAISPLDDLRVEEWDEMVDVNVKGVLHGIGAALPVFRAQGSGHFVTVASTAAFRVLPAMAVYAGTKVAVRAICEGLRQEAGDGLRVTTVSPGAIGTGFAEASTNPEVRARITDMRDRIAIPPSAIAHAIAYAIEQPAYVDVSEIVVRPTAQG